MSESFAQVIARLNALVTELEQKPETIGALTIASGQASASGNNTLITPAAGTRVRVYYAAYNPIVAADCAFRFGAAGTLWLRNNVTANSVIAKDFGDLRFVQGAIDEALFLNMVIGVATNWTVFYLEV